MAKTNSHQPQPSPKRQQPRRTARLSNTNYRDKRHRSRKPLASSLPVQPKSTVISPGASGLVPNGHGPLVADDMIMDDGTEVGFEDTCVASEGVRGWMSNRVRSGRAGDDPVVLADVDAVFEINVHRLGEVEYYMEVMQRFGLNFPGLVGKAYIKMATDNWRTAARTISAYTNSNTLLSPTRPQLGLYSGKAYDDGENILGANGVIVFLGKEGAKEQEGVNLGFGIQIEMGLGRNTSVVRVGTLTGALRNANSSCDPNCRIVRGRGSGNSFAVAELKALRGIEKDEELTFNYGRQYFEEQGIQCACPPCILNQLIDVTPPPPPLPSSAKPHGRRISIMEPIEVDSSSDSEDSDGSLPSVASFGFTHLVSRLSSTSAERDWDSNVTIRRKRAGRAVGKIAVSALEEVKEEEEEEAGTREVEGPADERVAWNCGPLEAATQLEEDEYEADVSLAEEGLEGDDLCEDENEVEETFAPSSDKTPSHPLPLAVDVSVANPASPAITIDLPPPPYQPSPAARSPYTSHSTYRPPISHPTAKIARRPNALAALLECYASSSDSDSDAAPPCPTIRTRTPLSSPKHPRQQITPEQSLKLSPPRTAEMCGAREVGGDAPRDGGMLGMLLKPVGRLFGFW